MSNYYFIQSFLNGNVIDIQGASTKAGASLDAFPQKTTGNDNQLWKFVADPAGSGYYFIKSKLNGNVVDIAGASTKDGADLDANTEKKLDYDNQLWEFIPDSSSRSYFIKSKLNGNVIDIVGASTKAGALLDSWAQKSTGYDNQLWSIVESGGGIAFPPPLPIGIGSLSLVNIGGSSAGAVLGFGYGMGNGHLYQWINGGLWTDLGTPTGDSATYAQALFQPTLKRTLVFAGGHKQHLYGVYFDPAAPPYTWEDQGMVPASLTPTGGPGYINVSSPGGGISPVYQPTTNETYVFVIAESGSVFNLYDYHLSGTVWTWESHGAPSGTLMYGDASPNGAMYNSPTDQLYFFLIAQDGHLWDRHGGGSTWVWYDHGVPAGSPKLNFYATPVSQPATGQIFVFVTAGNGHLYCNNWNGTEWQWSDLGTPPSAEAAPGVAAVADPSSNAVYAFVTGGGSGGVGHLYVCQWNGTSWAWEDTGLANAVGWAGNVAVLYPPPPNHQLTLLVQVSASGGFPLSYGYLHKGKWVWQNVGMPT